ncbi:MAG: NAD(P)H-dependent oxidoreductase [Flavobacterium sp. JAD_PAG50586_2]|nr:MAG: NAD(P)H-dependent oxidoreductase [Flavobacterium sp. JAD_PAG50586_2]
MKNILHVISSPRGGESISIKLGNSITDQLIEEYPGSTLTHLDLNVNPYPHLSDEQINAMRTQPAQHSEIQKELVKRSDEAIAQLFDTDIIVISLPLYNFSIPSTLKSWLDHILRAGHTFGYTSEGPKGLVTGKKVYIAFASGNIYSDGPYQAYDFAIPYLKTALGFIGLNDVSVIRAEGTAISGVMENALEKAIESISV